MMFSLFEGMIQLELLVKVVRWFKVCWMPSNYVVCVVVFDQVIFFFDVLSCDVILSSFFVM